MAHLTPGAVLVVVDFFFALFCVYLFITTDRIGWGTRDAGGRVEDGDVDRLVAASGAKEAFYGEGTVL